MDRYQQAIQQKDKKRIYELMRQGEPISADLLPTIADVLEGKNPNGRPKRPSFDFADLSNCPEFLADLLCLNEYVTRYAELTGDSLFDVKTLSTKAIEQIAKERNKSAAHIKNILLGNRRAT
jgi:hypothetical protein